MKSSKSRLLATSSIVAAAVALASSGAIAEEKKAMEEEEMMATPPTLSLGGFYFMDAHFADEDGRDNDGPMRMVHDSEVHFNASGEMDNGLKVGARIEFEGAGGAKVDDHWVTLDGGWGRVMLGATDGVNVKTMVTAPSHPYGVTSGLQTDWFHALAATKCAFRCALGGARLDAGTDETGVHYFSPRFNGFQFAVGFRPEATGSGSVNSGAVDESTELHNAVDIAANYAGELGGVGIKASIAAGAAQAPSTLVTPNKLVPGDHGHAGDAPPTITDPNPHGDYEHVAGGIQLSMLGFTVGGHIADEGTDGPQNGSSYGAGISYSTGPFLVAIDGFSGSIRDGSESGDSEYQAWSIGGQYTVGPGLRFIAGFQSGTVDLDDADPVDGNAFSAGIAVNF